MSNTLLMQIENMKTVSSAYGRAGYPNDWNADHPIAQLIYWLDEISLEIRASQYEGRLAVIDEEVDALLLLRNVPFFRSGVGWALFEGFRDTILELRLLVLKNIN